jgi:hypothetical protein
MRSLVCRYSMMRFTVSLRAAYLSCVLSWFQPPSCSAGAHCSSTYIARLENLRNSADESRIVKVRSVLL